MGRRIVFHVSDGDWLAMMWPEYARKWKDAFRCTYAIEQDENGQRYELLTSDGRTNYNDLNAYEKSCLWDCQEYFDNRLQIVGCPAYCTSMEVDGRIMTANGERRDRMTINDMIEQGITFQGPRIVTSLTDDMQYEQILYEGEDEWTWSQLEDEWADWDVNYIHPRKSGDDVIEIELDNPNN